MLTTKEKNFKYAEILVAAGKELKLWKKGTEQDEEKENAVREIYEGAMLLLLKNGLLFYTGTNSLKNAKDIYLSIDRVIYQIGMEQVRKEFGNQTNDILQKGFRENKVNNAIFKPEKETAGTSKKKQAGKPNKNELDMNAVYTEFMGLESEPTGNRQRKQERVEEKREEIKIQPEEDNDIALLDFEDEPEEEIPVIEKEDVVIQVEELIMDVFNVSVTGKQPFMIIAAPIEKSGDSFVPMFLLARSGKKSFTNATADYTKPSCQVSFQSNRYMVRGKWDADQFSTVLYTPGLDPDEIKTEKKQLRPKDTKNIGHNVSYLDGGIAIHVLPLSSRNSQNGKLGIIACLEDQKQKKLVSGYSNGISPVEIEYKEKTYQISAIWKDRTLLSDISISG